MARKTHKKAVLENETQKIHWNFEIQTNHLISARRPDLVIVDKKKSTCRILHFAVPPDYREKLKGREKKNKYQDLAREWKKNVEHESDGDTNCNWCTWYSH